ncbi:MAG: hypothetical protein WA162_01495 [Thermodesulfobacteriota bacterium]
MTSEERAEFRQSIRDDIKEAVHENLGAYKVPKEQHYLDHLFITELREWQSTVKSTTLKAVIGVVVVAFGTLLFYGFLFLKGNK